LVIAGEEDRVTPPRESEILAKGIRNSTLSVIPEAGHFSMLEKPAAFNRILRRFLDKQAPRGDNLIKQNRTIERQTNNQIQLCGVS
jgi:alpha-beta hydrolase superfamily lysophospholipase